MSPSRFFTLIIAAIASPTLALAAENTGAPTHLRCEGLINPLGIDAAEPGFRKILIRPQPGGGLTWAKGSLDSTYGTIRTHWKLEGKTFNLEATIPPNTTATIQLPDGTQHEVGPETHSHTTTHQ